MSTAHPLRKFMAPEFVFGEGASLLAARYMRNFGARHCLLVSDAGVMAHGHAGRVIATLTESDIQHTLFTDISPNPRDEQVMRGAALYKSAGCDAIVVVGGGSPMDCAKGIGIVAANGGHILDYEGVDAIPRPMPPLICIPTTSGSAADVSQFAIITDTTRKLKIAIVSKAAVPDVSLIDPATTVTMGPTLTAATGLDALTHAIEAYASNANSPITDMFALEAIRLAARHLPEAMEHPENMEARGGMALASLNAGLAFSNAILGAVHAMAHSLGGLLDLPHGECNAILLPHVVRRNYDAAPERYKAVAAALGLAPLEGDALRDALFNTLVDLRKRVGFTRTLRDFGVTREHISQLAALAVQDPCLATNPAALDAINIEELYAEAL